MFRAGVRFGQALFLGGLTRLQFLLSFFSLMFQDVLLPG
jgi:hypothetical protein